MSGREIISPRAPRVVWGERQLAYSQESGINVRRAVGAPFLYVKSMYAATSGLETLGSGLPLVFPYHGTVKDPVDYTHEAYARTLFDNFGQVSVCLHVNEYSDNFIVNSYARYGHNVVTAGSLHSPVFLINQMRMLEEASVVIINRLSTAAWYAGHMRKAVIAWGPHPTVRGERGPHLPDSLLEVEERLADASVRELEWFHLLADYELGLEHMLTPLELRNALHLTDGPMRPLRNGWSMVSDLGIRFSWKVTSPECRSND